MNSNEKAISSVKTIEQIVSRYADVFRDTESIKLATSLRYLLAYVENDRQEISQENR